MSQVCADLPLRNYSLAQVSCGGYNSQLHTDCNISVIVNSISGMCWSCQPVYHIRPILSTAKGFYGIAVCHTTVVYNTKC